MPLTPQLTITGNLIDLTGSMISGSATFMLQSSANSPDFKIAGTGIVVPRVLTTTVGASFSQLLYGNDVIVDSFGNTTSYYNVLIINSVGATIWNANYQFTGSGTINLLTATPINPGEIVPPDDNVVPANEFFGGPTSGSSAFPSYRLLVAADLPASGFVTSVALTVPSIFSVSGSPITSTGTFALALVTESPNLVFAGPSSGSAAVPTFRSLVAADVPVISLTSGISGILPLANGGTGANLSATGGTSFVLQQSSSGAVVTVSQLAASDLSNGTTGSGAVVLATSPTLVTPALGTPSSVNLANATFPTLNQNTTGNAATATAAAGLTDATGTVVVSAATAPINGQVLTATSSTVANWQNPSTGITVTAVDLTAQSANIGATTIVTPSANGFYRVSVEIVITQAASTSSTLPIVQIAFTEGSSGVAITYDTASYASSGGTPMQYALHLRLEGPF